MKRRKRLFVWITLAMVLFISSAFGVVLCFVWEPIIEPHLNGCIATQTSVGPPYKGNTLKAPITQYALFHNGKKVRFFAFGICYTCLRWKETSEFVLVTKEGSLRVLVRLKAPRIEPYFAIDPTTHKVYQSDGLHILKEEWTPNK
jgi:hypothetical protein